MEGGFATTIAEQHHTTALDIPSDIYQPLLSIALQGYEAADIDTWYRSILSQLQVGSSNAGTSSCTYNGPTPTTDEYLDLRYAAFLNTGSADRRATMTTIDSCVSPVTKVDTSQAGTVFAFPSQEHGTQAYSAPQSYQTYATTPQQSIASLDPVRTQLLPAWSPAPSSSAGQDMYSITASPAGNTMSALSVDTSEINTPHSWYGIEDSGRAMHNRTPSQQSHISQQSLPAYQASQHFSQTELPSPQQPYIVQDYSNSVPDLSIERPFLIPFASTTSGATTSGHKRSGSGQGGASLYSSSSGSYFPIIHVSTSRRRRKPQGSSAGVKKVASLPAKAQRRQQSV